MSAQSPALKSRLHSYHENTRVEFRDCMTSTYCIHWRWHLITAYDNAINVVLHFWKVSSWKFDLHPPRGTLPHTASGRWTRQAWVVRHQGCCSPHHLLCFQQMWRYLAKWKTVKCKKITQHICAQWDNDAQNWGWCNSHCFNEIVVIPQLSQCRKLLRLEHMDIPGCWNRLHSSFLKGK